MLLFVYPVLVYGGSNLKFGHGGSNVAKVSNMVLAEAYKKLSIDVEFIKLPHKRSLLRSNNGDIDGESNRIEKVNELYPNLIRISVPVQTIEWHAFSTRDIRVNNWESLKDYSVAYLLGRPHTDIHLASVKNKEAFTDGKRMFQLVELGRYDIVAEVLLTGLTHIRQSRHRKTRSVGIIDRINLYHFLHKKHKNLAPELNVVLMQMEESGRINEIRQQFIKSKFGITVY